MEGIAGIDPADLLRAGVDVLLDPPDAEATVRAVVRAVEEGRLADDVVEAACARVLRLKQRVADRWGTPDLAPPPAEARAAVDRAKHRRAADAIARAAVRVLDDAPGALPLDPRARTLVLLAAPERLTTDAEAFAAVVRRHLPAARVRLAPPDLTPEDAADVAEVASASEAVVCALVVEPAAWQRYGLAEPQVRVVRALAEAAGPRRPVVVAALGSPHVLADVPSGAARVCTYSAVPASQRALFAHLVGVVSQR
jgi:beta-glucosidase-like glycosyl hydrolase